MGQRGEGAVGRGVRIATDHRHARQGRTLFGADHVHDALTLVVHAEVGQAEFFCVAIQRLHLQARDGIGDAVGAIRGGDVVVGHHQVGGLAPGLATG